MNSISLLFENPTNGSQLFKNQQDLVNQLLTTPQYFINSENEGYLRAQSRLKAYVSQLLSNNVTRSVTDDFKRSLHLLLTKKINDTLVRDHIFEQIITDLEFRNSINLKTENKQASLYSDIANASYISIITARSWEDDLAAEDNDFSISKIFITDLLSLLSKKRLTRKYYRFNFPLESHCELLWMGLHYLLKRELSKFIDNIGFIENLNSEIFALKTSVLNIYDNYKKLRASDADESLITELKIHLIENVSNNLIETLNQNNIITVYQVTEPIFTVPVIAINPDNFSTATLYILIEDENNKIKHFKSTSENMYLWKMFVWDKLKASKTSRNIPCPSFR